MEGLSLQYRENQQSDLIGLFKGVEWQVMLSGCINADRNHSLERIDGLVARWHSMASKKASLQIGLIGILVSSNGLHAHLLLIGKNRYGFTLNNLDEEQVDTLQRLWTGLLGGTCRLSKVYDIEGVNQYIVNKNLINRYTAVLSPRGMPLLNKCRRKNAEQNSTCR